MAPMEAAGGQSVVVLTNRHQRVISPGMIQHNDGPEAAVPWSHELDGGLLRLSVVATSAALDQPLVLAVSGGSDSMALLFAMERWARDRIAAVATFDHGTGNYAREAASLVAAQGRRLGLTVVRERARRKAYGEAAWREARWDFLNRVACGFGARVATAHTRDDQVETIVMRLLRGTGTRGLAALAAPSRIVRPWLALARDELREWLDDTGLPYLEDPMNISRRYLRVRVRLDLLPALEAASPGFSEAMLGIGERAALWRREVERYLDVAGVRMCSSGRAVSLPTHVLEETTEAGRAVLWQALCGRLGVALDARGTTSAVRFTSSQRWGIHITVAGGASIVRMREQGIDVFVVRLPERPYVEDECSASAGALPSRLGGWRFRMLAANAGEVPDDWTFGLPDDRAVVVRRWAEGDRIRTARHPAGRRVTRYFTESRIPTPDRKHWPVVLVDGELVWVPGVCRTDAAPFRSGRPGLNWYRCERESD